MNDPKTNAKWWCEDCVEKTPYGEEFDVLMINPNTPLIVAGVCDICGKQSRVAFAAMREKPVDKPVTNE